MNAVVRRFQTKDAARLGLIYRQAAAVVGSYRYTGAQVAAWRSRAPDAGFFLGRHEKGDVILIAADDGDDAVGYALLEPDGHLDHLYIHPTHTRRGIADSLLLAADRSAMELGVERLFAEASELARPVFERAGYVCLNRRDFTIEHDGTAVPVHNYAMEKRLR